MTERNYNYFVIIIKRNKA